MANTVDLDQLEEYYDEPQVLQTKARELANIIRNAKHGIFFTGAGISTGANIADFRGPNGVWTRQAQGKDAPESESFSTAKPTLTHRLIKSLVDEGAVKYIVSQNVDGLHIRSGVPRSKISELHGNSFLEVCWKCDADFLHDFEVPSVGRRNCAECKQRVPHFCHCSGTRCTKCGAMLKDSIIHFGENLPVKDLNLAYEHAKLADVCIAAGSSCRVSPANDVPKTVGKKKGGTLVIINLQKTPLDHLCSLRVWGKMDEFFALVEEELRRSSPPSSSSAPPSAPVSSVNSLRIVQTCTKEPRQEDYWRWNLRVEPQESIEWVTYKLHPSFPEPVVTSNRPPFDIERVGWGVFNVEMEIKVIDRQQPIKAAHMLNFTEASTTTELKL